MQMNPLLGSTFAAIAAVSCAGIVHAGLATSQAIVVDISCQFIGMPGYEGLQTFRIYLQFTSASDSLLHHTQWSVGITGGTFFNSEPVDGIATGNIPVNPLFITAGLLPADYAWDTNISMDNSFVAQTSSEEPVMDFTPSYVGGFHIGGGGAGVFNSNPINPVTPGADMMIQVAQLTFSAGAPIVGGTFVALTPSGLAGATPTTIFIIPPSPGTLGALMVAGLFGRRRRRVALRCGHRR